MIGDERDHFNVIWVIIMDQLKYITNILMMLTQNQRILCITQQYNQVYMYWFTKVGV